ncbi:histidine kinase [Streptomyces sp. NPDC021096]|uniref:sensor histidine kinase n=1 Tax=Streptomyces sp. NPDC021096 TaxID=3154792 RepID=UPI0033D0D55B
MVDDWTGRAGPGLSDEGARAVVRRLRPRELLALDALAAVVLMAAFLAISGASATGSAAPPAARVTLAALMGLPVAVRRLWPVPVCAVTAVASLVAALSGVVSEPFLSVALALYWVAVTAPRARWVPTPTIGLVSVVFLLAVVLAGASTWEPGALPMQVVGVALAGAAWATGRAVRERRAYAARSARQLADRAVAEERLRIARELHDVVAHHIGVIAVKAGVAHHVLAEHPEAAGEALGVIGTASRAALAEMRHMLGVLRSDGTTDEEVADLRPSLGLSELSGLVEHAAAAGVEVEVRARDLRGLPGTVDLSAYRIVQEALTNVMKHAGPTRCRVELDTDEHGLRIRVTDDGPRRRPHPRPGVAPGHGLLGMRERVALHGGDFRAGPRPEGGFAVSVRLPFTRQAG